MHHDRIPIYKTATGESVGFARVDESDLAIVCAYRRWYLDIGGYVVTSEKRTGRTLYLHRQVMGLGPRADEPIEVDHINRDRLDCRRANLRLVTRRENCQNQESRGHTSRFRGVHWDNHSQGWRARVRRDGKSLFEKRFASELEAALAVEEARRIHMPFAMPDPALAEAGLPEAQMRLVLAWADAQGG